MESAGSSARGIPTPKRVELKIMTTKKRLNQTIYAHPSTSTHSTPAALCSCCHPSPTGYTGGYSHWSPSDFPLWYIIPVNCSLITDYWSLYNLSPNRNKPRIKPYPSELHKTAIIICANLRNPWRKSSYPSRILNQNKTRPPSNHKK